jgi:SAM-dependent methyltransferase
MLARLRHRAWHARNDTREVHDRLVRSHAAGAGSFLDVGCMWRIDGANSFAAEEAGAANVTALDIMGATAAFEERHRAVGSRVRFVQGDVNDPGIVEAHGVVWCSGVLYHVPDPLLTLRRLRALALDRLLLATEISPGRRGGAVFLPTRRDHPGAPEVAPPDASGYAPWYWLPTAPAVRSMLSTTGFEVDDEIGLGPFHRVFSAHAAT